VVIAVTVSSILVGILFGYSFATWRFHLRGLSIRGGHDVGRISDLPVGWLMGTDARAVPENLDLPSLAASSASSSWLGKAAMPGRLIPTICTIRRLTKRWTAVAGDLAETAEQFLLLGENIRGALAHFDALTGW